MPRTKKKFVCVHKPMPVLNDDNSDCDIVVNLAAAKQSESENMLSQETVENKRCAKNVMSADTEDVFLEWIREIYCLYQKGLRDDRDTLKRSRLWDKKAAEMDMTGDFFFNF